MKKLLLLILPLFTLQAVPELLREGTVYIPERVGRMVLEYKDREFYAYNDKGSHKIQRCFIDKGLRGISTNDLAEFLKNGYIDVNNCGEDTYRLRARYRLKGAGPITASIIYFGVKGIAYGTIAAGIITGIKRGAHAGSQMAPTPSDGIEGTVVGAGVALAAQQIPKIAGTTGPATGPVVGALMGSKAGREASQAVVGVAGGAIASGTVTAASITGAIETVATAGAAWGMALPLP